MILPMDKRFFSSLIIMLCAAFLFSPSATHAQIKDSTYFMYDDGEQSPEEMAEEAEYVYGVCARNTYQSKYFNCECVAGAFLQAREKAGPVVPQDYIINEITRGENAQCANTVEIAGDAYSMCQSYARTFREYRKDNEEYCQCVGNTMARDFSKAPYLRTAYIRKLRTNALVACNNRDDQGNPR